MTRMLPTRYLSGGAKPIMVKKQPGKVSHLAAPLKGYDPASQLSGNTRGTDVMTAPIMKNFVIFENRIECRSGTQIMGTDAGGKPIESFVPYFGPAQALLAGTNGKLVHCFDMTTAKSGFTANVWAWTSFANLGQQKYTVMCNGKEGVWSWDGGTTADSAPVAITAISKANPAVCTVAAADIGKFTNGQNVVIAGISAVGFTVCNGAHIIGSVNSPANTFTLVGIDTSAATGTYAPAGVTAVATGSFVQENIAAPSGSPWVDPMKFSNVIPHMNRLWFADDQNLAVYYLPVQQKSGTLAILPLNAYFRRGGTIRAMFSWSIDGGAGMDDVLAIFSSNGECVLYKGTDPASDFSLVGIYRFDSPLGKGCVTQYGGDLYVLISSGLVPMSVLMRAGQDELGEFDKRVASAFKELSKPYRDVPGWQLMLDSSLNRIICNMPLGAPNKYRQIVRDMLDPAWMPWEDVPGRTWIWFNNNKYFGDDSGNVWWMDQTLLNDNGNPINVDVQWAWSDYGTPAFKQYKMVRPYIITDGVTAPFVDIRTDYDQTPPTNQPDVAYTLPGAKWDVSPWDTSAWAMGLTTIKIWNGVAGSGTIAAPRISAAVRNCKFALSGIDIIYEMGSIMG